MKTLGALLSSLLFLGTAAFAQFVTISFNGERIRDSGGDPLPDGRLVLLLANVGLADTQGEGFGSLSDGSIGQGDLLNGSYQILGRAAVDGSFSNPGDFAGVASLLGLKSEPFPNLSTGDQLAVAWFPTLSFSDDYALLTGVSYGLFTIDDSPAWRVPAQGTLNFTVTVPADAFASSTSVSAIPEPSTYAALFGTLALALAAWRRSRRST